jgi:hypothetical protein
MTAKQKIALHDLMKSVSRGIITEEAAKAKFEEITGRKYNEVPAEDDQDGKRLGKFIGAFSQAVQQGIDYQEEAAAAMEEDNRTVELNPPTDNLVKKRGKVASDKKTKGAK